MIALKIVLFMFQCVKEYIVVIYRLLLVDRKKKKLNKVYFPYIYKSYHIIKAVIYS